MNIDEILLYARNDLKIIQKAKKEILEALNQLIKEILTIQKTSLEKLCGYEHSLTEVLSNGYCPDPESLEAYKINVQVFDLNKIKDQMRKLEVVITYSDREEYFIERNLQAERLLQAKREEEEKTKKLDIKSKNYSAIVNDMDLRKKVEFFHPKILYKRWKDIDYCHTYINSILLTNDSKFVFVYWGIDNSSCLDVYNLDTKSRIDGWTTNKEPTWHSNEEKQNLIEWIKKYPECKLDSWDFSVLNN